VGTNDYPKIEPFTPAKTFQVKTNGFKIDMTKTIPVLMYRVEGRISFLNEPNASAHRRDVEFTRPEKDEYVLGGQTKRCLCFRTAYIDQKNLGRRSFALLNILVPEQMPNPKRSYYDGAYTFYSLDPVGNNLPVRLCE
jgi:hypothetical protein